VTTSNELSPSALFARAREAVRADRRVAWVALAAVVLMVRWILGLFPHLAETVYSRGVFVAVRTVQDYTFGLLPFPAVYLFGAAVAVAAGWGLRRALVRLRGLQSKPMGMVLRELTWSVGAGVSAIIVLFMALWGYNYARPSVSERLGLRVDELATGELVAEARRAAREAAAARRAFTDGLEGNWPAPLPTGTLEERVREPLVQVLEHMGYTPPGSPRLRSFWSGSFMLRLSVTGFYLPFTGESHLCAGLLPVERPFVAAHEMAHAYGFTDEGEANFLAWLACRYSQDPWMAYSGRLRYLMSIMGRIRRRSPEHAAGLVLGIDPAVLSDMARVREHHRRYRAGVLGRAWWRTYDLYLRSQGVAAGSRSYSQMVPLAIAWRQRAERNTRDR
jgi:hypothetical protein